MAATAGSRNPSAEAIEQQIARVVASTRFQTSQRLRELLHFTVSQALRGGSDTLKESVLGVEVFGRKPGYDSESSSVVRVEFARLRKKLEEYYQTEGRDDPVRICYLKGSYVPEFRWREEAAPALGEPAAYASSLAVLPLVHQGSNPDDEYFADGLTDELITALSRVRGLKVVARTSSFAFKGRADDVREIGRTLKVDSVLEGSVRRQKDLLRIHVQLIDVNDGCQLWAQKYERRLTDVFEVQDEIAAAIVEALKLELPRVRAGRLLPRTKNAEAHELYLKGRYWWHRWTAAALSKAAVFFGEAIERDPSYAAPYSGLADCYFLQGFHGFGRPADLMGKAYVVARKALEIDETLAEAHCSLALLENAWNWDSARCEAEFRRCLELNPGYALALAKYGTSYLTTLGRFEEASEYISRALELDPLSPYIHADLACNYGYRGLMERFEVEARKVLEMDPGMLKVYWTQVYARWRQGDWAGAAEAAEKGLAVSPDDPLTLAFAAWASSGRGDRVRAEEIRRSIHRLAESRYIPPSCLALTEFPFGSADAVFDQLEKGVELRDPILRFLRVFPFDLLKSDPRYNALLRKVGL